MGFSSLGHGVFKKLLGWGTEGKSWELGMVQIAVLHRTQRLRHLEAVHSPHGVQGLHWYSSDDFPPHSALDPYSALIQHPGSILYSCPRCPSPTSTTYPRNRSLIAHCFFPHSFLNLSEMAPDSSAFSLPLLHISENEPVLFTVP